MDLDTLVKETVKRIVEGGKALGGDRIARADVQPTVDAFKQRVLSLIPYRAAEALGSTGKKDDSGDIDLGVETEWNSEQIDGALAQLGLPKRLFKGLGQVSVLFPQHSAGGPNGKQVQVDIIVGDLAYLKWSHPSPADSKYKGFYTRAVANGIVQATTGKHINVSKGVFSKGDPDKKYSTDLAGLARAIGRGWTADDLTMSLEKIWDKAKRTLDPEQLDQVRDYVAEFMKHKRAPFPEELNEAVRPAAHQFERLQDAIIANCPSIKRITEVPPGSIPSGAVFRPSTMAIHVQTGLPEPWRSYAVAHEAGHVRDLNTPEKIKRAQELVQKIRSGTLTKEESDEYVAMEQRGWDSAEWFLQKAGIPIDQRFQQRRDKSMASHRSALRKFSAGTFDEIVERLVSEAVPKIARGIVPGYGSIRPATSPAHSKGAQVGQGNIGGARNRGIPGYPVPPEMMSKRGQEGEVDGGGLEVLEGTKKPDDLDWGIKHLDDLKPDEFMVFLKKYAESPLELEISEKVDGSARMSFGIGGGAVWTQTKTGTRKAMSNQYPNTVMFKPVKEAHKALESKKKDITDAWPEGITFMVAEVLYGKIPNAIEYGDNRLVIHGVHGYPTQLDDARAKQAAQQVIRAIGGQAGDFKVEYKRTINHKDVMIDVRVEYDTLGQLYKNLQQKPRDKEAAAHFKTVQKAVKEKLIKMLHTQKSAYGPEGGDIEGLVYRDLETGQMVKLVDKDYFKKLVEFMWSWRNKLNKDVMGGFREVVAQHVLGDKGAASNRLVSDILASGQPDPKLKPEQAADRLIAGYIQKKNLMKPDFYAHFQRSLMGAFEDLEKLKLQWEKLKDAKHTTTIRGKTREMGSDVKERTSEAINDAYASLQGIRAGMEVASDIKDPLTQKVALFKLFMGHKFQRLVDQIGGAEKLDESVFDPDDETEARASAIFPSNTARPRPSERSYASPKSKAMLRQFLPKINQRIGANIDAERDFIDAGTQASAYDLHDGRVFKLTRDSTDAQASAFFKKHPSKHVVRVDDVFKLPIDRRLHTFENYNYYGIVVEKLWQLRDQERSDLEQVVWILELAEDHDWATLKASLMRPGSEKMSGPTELSIEMIGIIEKHGLDEMIDEFARSGFYTRDLHAGNVMKRGDGTWVISDLGYSKSEGGGIPVLEGGPIDRMTGATDFSGRPRIDGVGLDDAERANEASNWLKGITAAAMMGLASPQAQAAEPAPPQAKSISSIIQAASAETGVSADLIRAMMSVESGGKPDAVSPAGARGLMQLMPKTAQRYGAKDPHDPEQNIMAAARYIKKLQQSFGNKLDWVLAAYNMGPNALHKSSSGEAGYPQETRDYVKRVKAALAKLKAAQPKSIENAVKEIVARLVEEAHPEFVGAVVGRFQPFHAGHAEMIRQLAQRFTRVLVFVAGLKQDKDNPFSYDLRIEMMEKSLPDVWSKIRVYPARIQGRGTGYLPGLIANVVQAGELDPNQPVINMAGEDRFEAAKKQVEHNKQNAGKPGYHTGTIEVEAMPGVKSDDDADQVSGTRIRRAIASGDRKEVKRLLDPHLTSDPASLENLFVRMEAEMKTDEPQTTLEAIMEEVLNEMGMGGLETGVGWTRGGAWGSSGWSRAVLAGDEDGDAMYQQMMRSPSTRMLPMANHGTPNSDLPGVNRIDGDTTDDELNEPTDLDEMIDEAIKDVLRKGLAVR